MTKKRLLNAFLFVFFGFQQLQAQTISTIAGISSATYSGDGGPATLASMHFPLGIAVDKYNNLYIADVGNNRIRKVDAAGIISTIAGNGMFGYSGDGGPATNAKVNGIEDLTMDDKGNIYFTDQVNSLVRKIDASGIITSISTGGVAQGIAVDTAGYLYVSSTTDIVKVTSSGIITIAGTGTVGYSGDGGPASAAQFSNIRDIAIDKANNIYIADAGNYRIRKINTSGIVTTIAGTGINGFAGDGAAATAARISVVRGVFSDDAGNVYVTDWNPNNRVRKINTLGIIITIAGDGMGSYFGGDGGPATAAGLDYIMYIAKYGGGNIFISDRNNNRVRMITDTNHATYFTGAHTKQVNVCGTSVALDTLLATADIDTNQVDAWSVIYGPLHGSITSSYMTYTTGGIVIPSGFTYIAATGYAGFDTVRMQVSDGYTADTLVIYLRIDAAPPNAGLIAGPDTVCIGHTITLTDVTATGIGWDSWAGSNATATVSGNIVTGSVAGIDTVLYAVVNACGTAIATHTVVVKACISGVLQPLSGENSLLHISPNPGNGQFTFSLTSPTAEEVQVLITDMAGRKVKEVTTATNKVTDIQLNMPAGVYFLSAVTAGAKYVAKVVVAQ